MAANNDLTNDDFTKIGFSKTPKWLEKNKAGFVELEDRLTIDDIKPLRLQLNAKKIDVFCTRYAAHSPKQLFLADMDSTIVTSETLDEMAEEAGIKDQISAITERAMRGELDFHAALKERVGMLKGLNEDVLKRTLDKTALSNGAETLLAGLKTKNITTVLVSGGFTYFTQAIADQLGFDYNHGNILLVENSKLTGSVGMPILDKDSKLEYLQSYVQRSGIKISDTVAIGDGANDLPMLESAGLGIGYHPKPLVADTIPNCIIHTDLSSVLYLL